MDLVSDWLLEECHFSQWVGVVPRINIPFSLRGCQRQQNYLELHRLLFSFLWLTFIFFWLTFIFLLQLNIYCTFSFSSWLSSLQSFGSTCSPVLVRCKVCVQWRGFDGICAWQAPSRYHSLVRVRVWRISLLYVSIWKWNTGAFV